MSSGLSMVTTSRITGRERQGRSDRGEHADADICPASRARQYGRLAGEVVRLEIDAGGGLRVGPVVGEMIA